MGKIVLYGAIRPIVIKHNYKEFISREKLGQVLKETDEGIRISPPEVKFIDFWKTIVGGRICQVCFQ